MSGALPFYSFFASIFNIHFFQQQDDKPAPKITFPKGAVIYFEGYSETVTRELIKEAVAKLGKFLAFSCHNFFY